MAHHAPRLRDDGLAPHLVEIVHGDDAHPHVVAVLDVVVAVARAAQADLHGAARIDELLLDGAAEGCGVIDPAAEELVEGVRVGVEVDEAERALLGDAAEDGQRHRMVAAGRDGNHRLGVECRVEPGDRGDAAEEVEGIDRRVADVAHAAELEGSDAARGVHLADEAGHLADLRRAVAGAGPVGRAEVEGNAGEGDLELRRIGHLWRAHEGRGLREARHHGGIERGVTAVVAGAHVAPRKGRAILRLGRALAQGVHIRTLPLLL